MRSSQKRRLERCHLTDAFLAAFPDVASANYESILKLPGHILKREKRTTILLLESAHVEKRFVLKLYEYSQLARLRSWHLQSKAEREFHALSFCAEQGIPAVRPMGYGTKRSRLGQVLSCFLLTEYAEGYVPLRDWLRSTKGQDRQPVHVMMREIGGHMRRAHAERFFFFRLLAKNVLVRPEEGRLDWLLLDQCYARRLEQTRIARAGQLRDIGGITASVARYCGEDVAEDFYTSYLPDPLGGSESQLRRLGDRGKQLYLKETPLKRLVHFIRPGSRGHERKNKPRLTHKEDNG